MIPNLNRTNSAFSHASVRANMQISVDAFYLAYEKTTLDQIS